MINVEYRDTVGSTQDEMRLQARAGAPEFSVLVAQTQTAGRGRRGKTWQSQAGAGLYFTILLRPTVSTHCLGLLPLLVGAVIAESIDQNLGLPTQLKWSNDLLTLDGRKLCGVLLESEIKAGIVKFVLLGIGINIARQDFPSQLKAAALEEFVPVNRTAFLTTLLENLERAYQAFLVEPEMALQRWKALPNNLGQEIQVLMPNGETWSGIATDLDSSGALIVQTATGIRLIHAAEVSLKRH